MRDENGRFVKGQSGNPGGRTRNEAAAMMRNALAKTLDEKAARDIATKLIEQVRRGDVHAREQLFRFLGLFDDRLSVDSNVMVVSLDEVLRRVYGEREPG